MCPIGEIAIPEIQRPHGKFAYHDHPLYELTPTGCGQDSGRQQMRRFFQKLLEWLRKFFVVLFEDTKETDVQTKIPIQEQQREIARPVELGISNPEKPEYRKSKSVLTYRERILLRAIRRAVAGDYTILMKVRMGDFVWLANEPQDRKFHSNQVQCKHVDFLLCDKVMLEPLLVIELDDSSHRIPDHAARDKFKDETFDAIGLPIIRLQIRENYDGEALKRQIHEIIGAYQIVT